MSRETTIPRQRGFALIIVLWTIVLLTLLATQLTSTGRAEARLASNLRGAALAQAEADGCVYQAVEQLLAGSVRWPPDASPRPQRLPGARAIIRIGSDDGKFDLNAVPADILTELLRAIGVDGGDARQLATDIVLWRFPSAQTTERRRAYLQAGLGYAPPGASFQSVSELALVLGMTPAVLDRLQPHVTIYHEGDPDPRAADPVVRVILAERGALAGTPAANGPASGVAVIDVTVELAGGSRAARHAVVRIGSPSDRGGWRILAWS